MSEIKRLCDKCQRVVGEGDCGWSYSTSPMGCNFLPKVHKALAEQKSEFVNFLKALDKAMLERGYMPGICEGIRKEIEALKK